VNLNATDSNAPSTPHKTTPSPQKGTDINPINTARINQLTPTSSNNGLANLPRSGTEPLDPEPSVGVGDLLEISKEDESSENDAEMEKENAERVFLDRHIDRLNEVSQRINDSGLEDLNLEVTSLILQFKKELQNFIVSTKEITPEERSDHDERSKTLLKKWEGAHIEIEQVWESEARNQVLTQQREEKRIKFDLDAAEKLLKELSENTQRLKDDKRNLTHLNLETVVEVQELEKRIKDLEEQLLQKNYEIKHHGDEIDTIEKQLEDKISTRASTEHNRDELRQKLEVQTETNKEELSQSKAQLRQYDNWCREVKTLMSELDKAHEQRWRDWNPEDIVSWICKLDNGKYKEYKEVLTQNVEEKLESGTDLTCLDMNTLLELGIKKIPHRKHILAHIKSLEELRKVKNQLDETPSRKKVSRELHSADIESPASTPNIRQGIE